MGGMGVAMPLAKRGFTNINVWESDREIGEVGAEISSAPDLSRILDNWDVLEILTDEVIGLKSARIIKSHSDAELTSVDFAYIEKEFRFPFSIVHRLVLQKPLVAGALGSDVVDLHVSKLVTDINSGNSSFFFEDRSDQAGAVKAEADWFKADVILATDGVKSKAQAAMVARHGEADTVTDTGQPRARPAGQHPTVAGEDY